MVSLSREGVFREILCSGPCAPPTSSLNTESAVSLPPSLSLERERGSEREARTGIEEGWTRMGRKRREREAEGCTGFVGYAGPGNSGTEPSSSPSLSGILIIRAGSLRGEQPGQGCSAAGLLFASCPVLRGYRPPTACSSRVPFSFSLRVPRTALPFSRRIHSRARSPVASRVLMSFVEHLSVKREGSIEKFRRCYRSFPLFFFFCFRRKSARSRANLSISGRKKEIRNKL